MPVVPFVNLQEENSQKYPEQSQSWLKNWIEINRVQSRITVAMYKQKLKNSTQQKAGTRTLIQAGTLLKLAGFFERCHIEDGDDLQDFGAQDRAATLLGALMEAFEKMPHEPTDKQLAQWKTKGAAVMKMQKAKVLKHKAPV